MKLIKSNTVDTILKIANYTTKSLEKILKTSLRGNSKWMQVCYKVETDKIGKNSSFHYIQVDNTVLPFRVSAYAQQKIDLEIFKGKQVEMKFCRKNNKTCFYLIDMKLSY